MERPAAQQVAISRLGHPLGSRQMALPDRLDAVRICLDIETQDYLAASRQSAPSASASSSRRYVIK
jgi:hypothetical protein